MGDKPLDDPLARLVTRAQAGDEGAFAELYEKLYPRIWAFVVRRRSQRQDAEDVVSRTFHSLLAKLDSFDPRRGSVAVFVIAFARHAMIDDARATRPSVPLDQVQLTDAETPLSDILRDEELRALKKEVDRLGLEERDLLLMRFGDGLRYKEIAQLLRVREDAVKQRFSRLLRQLRVNVVAAMADRVPM